MILTVACVCFGGKSIIVKSEFQTVVAYAKFCLMGTFIPIMMKVLEVKKVYHQLTFQILAVQIIFSTLHCTLKILNSANRKENIIKYMVSHM